MGASIRFFLVFAFLSMAEAAETLSKVKLSWEKLEQAIRYEFEIANNPEMFPVIERKIVGTTSVAVELPIGTYYYRVRAIDRVEAPGKWTAPSPVVISPEAIPLPGLKPSPVALPSPVPSPTPKVKPVAKIPSKISGLEWKHEFINEAQQSFVIIRGSLKNTVSDRSLLINDRSVAGEGQEKFEIKLLMTSERMQIWIKAVSHFGVVEEERAEVYDPGFGRVKRKSGLYGLVVGLGPSYISYNQNLLTPFSEIVLSAKVSLLRALSSQWSFGFSSFVTIAPIFTDRQAIASARFLGLNARVGYSFPFVKEPWRLSLMSGIYYTTMFGTREFGFRNQTGPQLYPTLSRRLNNGDYLSIYFKYSPVTSRLQVLNLANREIASGVAWKHSFPNMRSLILFLDFADIHLGDSSADIRVFSGSLSVGYGF